MFYFITSINTTSWAASNLERRNQNQRNLPERPSLFCIFGKTTPATGCLKNNNEKFIREKFIEFYCYLKSVCLLEDVKNCLHDIQITINADN